MNTESNACHYRRLASLHSRIERLADERTPAMNELRHQLMLLSDVAVDCIPEMDDERVLRYARIASAVTTWASVVSRIDARLSAAHDALRDYQEEYAREHNTKANAHAQATATNGHASRLDWLTLEV